MATKAGSFVDMQSLNGPLSDIAARKTHKLAVSRDYNTQPRISELQFVMSM